MGVRTPGWGTLGGDQAAASGQRSKDSGASLSWGIMWPPHMSKASKTRVFARTLKVFLGGSRIHFRTRQSYVIAGMDGGRAFLVSELPPFATLTNSSTQVCFLLAVGTSRGEMDATTCSFSSLHGLPQHLDRFS